MRASDFRVKDRGVFPSGEADKGLANDRPFVSVTPERVLLSENQGGGGFVTFFVEKGMHVRRGQKIADPRNFTGTALHASVSGTVTDFVTMKMPNGERTFCVIEADADQPEMPDLPYMHQIVLPDRYKREGILAAMKDGGICGMGGAGFPAHIKYSADIDFDTLIINAMECEPYLCCDHRMMLEHPYEFINGALIMQKGCGDQKITL